MLFALNMAYGFFVEAAARRQITGLFGQYVPPELVDEMTQGSRESVLDGGRIARDDRAVHRRARLHDDFRRPGPEGAVASS